MMMQQQGGEIIQEESSKASMGSSKAGVTTNSSSLLILVFVISLLWCIQPTICCVQAERLSLLDFKAGLHDPNNSLASWVGQACCQWQRVDCSNRTGHVIILDLYDGTLGGEIRPSLLGLKHLRVLDLGGNNFQGITIPTFIASLKKLTYLDLTDSGFSGLIPYQLGNLSSLREFGLFSIDYLLYMDSGRWLSNLSSLQYLRLEGVDLSKADGWLESLNSLPSLSRLFLNGAELGDTFPLHLSHVNFTSLRVLYLAAVGMNSVPSWLFQIASLEELSLGSNGLQNLIPDSIGNLTSIRILDLSNNGHIREIPASFGKLCMLNYLLLWGNYYDADKFNELGETLTTTGCIKDSLNYLDSSSSNLTGRLPDWLWEFKNLIRLGLSNNSFYGAPLPPSHQQLPPLQYLLLDNNKLNGTIPETLGQLSELVILSLSYNNLEGVLSEASFSNLTKLQILDFSFNSFVLDVGSNWVPPLGLTRITFSHCKVGPAFPSWIRELSNLSMVDISHASIADAIPSWFWNFSSEITYVDLSNNEINGTLPSSLRHLINLVIIKLSNNLLEGPLPQFPSSLKVLDLSNNSLSGTVNIDMLMPHMAYLSVSTNHINGIIPVSICSNLKNLVALDFSKNHLSGEIPNCWDSNIRLKVMDLSNNTLSGSIPTSICSMPYFQSLHLNDNHLSGNLPLTLRNCIKMRILDLGQNMFNGTIPTWIGQTMPQLQVLKLRSNLFFGNIPPQLGHLKYLQFVDLALNNLSGTIPHSFADLRAIRIGTMPHCPAELYNNSVSTDYLYYTDYVDKINVIMKGIEEEYAKILRFPFSIDLAGNSLTGGIPKELTTLHGLHNLNLSRNYLTGTITEKIAELQSLESLDLSNNNLSGAIPSSMTAMHFLTTLNLSFNKFSGKIPSGGQLDALPDPSIYIGNQELCGFPLNKMCQYNGPSQPPQQLKTDSKIVEFYLSIGLGFVVSYLLFWGTLIIKNKWRIAYFRFVDDMFDWVYVAVAINMAKVKNKWNSL